MKKKLSLMVAIALLLALLLPLTAFAEGGILAFNYGGLVSVTAGAGETYASGKNPSNSGDTVNIRIPLIKDASLPLVGDITVTPVIGENYPFVQNSVAKTILKSSPDWFADFELKLKSGVYNGTYPVTFKAEYKYTDTYSSEVVSGLNEFTVYVEVTGRPAPAEPSESTPPPASQPRVMVTKYVIDPNPVVAGKEFEITVDFKNEGKVKVQNVKITVGGDGGVFLPAEGTNTAFVSSISAGKTVSKTFKFTVSPEASPTPTALNVQIAYENGDAVQFSENASISVPVVQPMRLKFGDATIYETMEGEPIYISIPLYNLGKSTVYNVMASVLGDGLMAEQSYFGGNLEPGGSKTIELSVNADTSIFGGGVVEPGVDTGFDDGFYVERGEAYAESSKKAGYDGGIIIDGGMDGGYYGGGQRYEFPGEVVVTYEDALGNQYTESIAFTAIVNGYYQEPIPEEPVGPTEPTDKPNLTWLYVTLGVLAVGGLVVFLVLRNRKKKRMIEDELL